MVTPFSDPLIGLSADFWQNYSCQRVAAFVNFSPVLTVIFLHWPYRYRYCRENNNNLSGIGSIETLGRVPTPVFIYKENSKLLFSNRHTQSENLCLLIAKKKIVR